VNRLDHPHAARTRDLGSRHNINSAAPQEVTGAERNLKRNALDDIYNIRYTTETAQQLAAHLYYPGCLSLERKLLAAASLASWVRPAGMERRPPHIQWTAEMDQSSLQRRPSPTQRRSSATPRVLAKTADGSCCTE
jgi:hypothetical protein